jgi:hypothetical protein
MLKVSQSKMRQHTTEDIMSSYHGEQDEATHTAVANLKVGAEELNGKPPTFTCISEAQIRSAT